MNKKINLDLVSLKYILDKNKYYILPILIFVASIILFFQLVIPQFTELQNTQQEANELSQQLEVLKTNLKILTNANEEILDSQFNTLTLALPLNKDVIKILNSIYITAQKVGVTLGGFSFVVGDIAKPDNKTALPAITFTIPINSDIAGGKNFIDVMSRTVPLSGINSVKKDEKAFKLELSFYYKPSDNSMYSLNAQIKPMSQNGLKLIDKLNGFEDASGATSSGEMQTTASSK